MRRALQALFPCLAILSGIVGTASGAYVDATSKNRVGVSEPNPDIHTYVLGSLELEPQRGDTILGYDPATGVVFYVNQNPWTRFDPLGLWLMEKTPSWYQKAASMPGGNFIVPGAIVVSAVDSVADPAIEGKGAYTSERNAGRSVASSVGFGAAVGVSRATGMLDVGEGVNRESISFSPAGDVTISPLTESEGNAKIVEGGTKMVGTATLLVGGARGITNKPQTAMPESASQIAAKTTPSTLHTRGVTPAPGTRTIQGQVDAATTAGNPTVQRGGQDLFRLRSSGHGSTGATTTPQNVRHVTPTGPRFGKGPDTPVGPREIRELYKAQTGQGTSTIRTRSGR